MDFFQLCNNHLLGLCLNPGEFPSDSIVEKQGTHPQSHRKTQPNAGGTQTQMKGAEVAQRDGHPKVGEDGKEARYACICQSPENPGENDLQGIEQLIGDQNEDEVRRQLGHLCFGCKKKWQLNPENQEKEADDEDHQQYNVDRCPGGSLQ